MLRSRAVAVLNPASDCDSSLILGIGNAFRFMCLFSSRKSKPLLVWSKEDLCRVLALNRHQLSCRIERSLDPWFRQRGMTTR
jgi:hypothetical protein